jgi:hypothetical protein
MPKIIKKHGKTALVFALILLLIGSYFLIPNTQAAGAISSRKMTISDSRTSRINVTYTFTGTHSGTSVVCIGVQFCQAATGTCTIPPTMDVNAAAATSTGWTEPWTYSYWSPGFATTTTGFQYAYATGEAGGASYAFATWGIGNSGTPGAYYARVDTYSDSCGGTVVDSGTAAFAILSGVTVTATVAETLTFTNATSTLDFGQPDGTNIRYATDGASSGGTNTEPGNGYPTVLTLATNAGSGAVVTIQDIGDGVGDPGIYKSAGTTKLVTATAPVNVVGNVETYAPYGKNAGANLTIAAGFQTGGGTVVTTAPQTFVTAASPLSTLNTFDLETKMGINAATPAGSYSDTLILIATPTF